jgi:hypothetical protein
MDRAKQEKRDAGADADTDAESRSIFREMNSQQRGRRNRGNWKNGNFGDLAVLAWGSGVFLGHDGDRCTSA